jgi:hypothetical protein
MASDWADERAAIEAYFNTNWGTTTPIKWENATFVTPGTQNRTRQPWVALFIREAVGSRASIGVTPLRRFVGTIIVQIFTDLNIGTNLARDYASQVADLWRDVTITGVGTTNGIIAIGGAHDGAFNTEPHITVVGDEGNGWFQTNVTVRYRRDDIF